MGAFFQRKYWSYLVQLGILKAQQVLKTGREQEEPATMDGNLFD